MKNKKRISFDEYQAEHIYEWLRIYWVYFNEKDKFGNCPLCRMIGERLEKFISPSAVRSISRMVNKERRLKK